MDSVTETTEAVDIEDANLNLDIPTKAVQILGMQWLDLKKITKTKSGEVPKTLEELKASIKIIIAKHNTVPTEPATTLRAQYAAKLAAEDDDYWDTNDDESDADDDESDTEAKRKKKGEKTKKYIYKKGFDEELSGTGYSMICYISTKSDVLRLSKETHSNPASSTSLDQIIFYYHPKIKYEVQAHIVALTAGNAWEVVRPYIDHSFPKKIIEEVGDSENIRLVKRHPIFNPNLKESESYVNLTYATSSLYKYVEEVKCRILTNSQLYPELSMKKGKNCLITITTAGMVKIIRELDIRKQYPKVLNLFAKYMRQVGQKKDLRFEFLYFMQPATSRKTELDNALISYLYSVLEKDEEMSLIHLQHSRYHDFLSCDSYKIQINSDKTEIVKELKSDPLEIKEVAKIITENGGDDEKNFEKIIKNADLICSIGDKVKLKYKLINFIGGEFQYKKNDRTYFRMRNMYYELIPSYRALLWEDFKTVIRNLLIEKESPWSLNKIWDRSCQKEEDYNQSYIGEPNFLVLDQVLPDGIESCDILRYTDKEAYLYHVKGGTANESRVTCSQIFNAATLLRDALVTWEKPGGRENYLKQLYAKALKPTDDKWKPKIIQQFHPYTNITEEVFLDIFLRRKLVFVYAYATSTKNSFSQKLKDSEKIETEKELMKKLELAGYLDSYGGFTEKFISTENEDQFVEECSLEGVNKTRKRKIYKQLHSRMRLTNSTIAMMELVKLVQDFNLKNRELKICEIEAVGTPPKKRKSETDEEGTSQKKKCETNQEGTSQKKKKCETKQNKIPQKKKCETKPRKISQKKKQSKTMQVKPPEEDEEKLMID